MANDAFGNVVRGFRIQFSRPTAARGSRMIAPQGEGACDPDDGLVYAPGGGIFDRPDECARYGAFAGIWIRRASRRLPAVSDLDTFNQEGGQRPAAHEGSVLKSSTIWIMC